MCEAKSELFAQAVSCCWDDLNCKSSSSFLCLLGRDKLLIADNSLMSVISSTGTFVSVPASCLPEIGPEFLGPTVAGLDALPILQPPPSWDHWYPFVPARQTDISSLLPRTADTDEEHGEHLEVQSRGGLHFKQEENRKLQEIQSIRILHVEREPAEYTTRVSCWAPSAKFATRTWWQVPRPAAWHPASASQQPCVQSWVGTCVMERCVRSRTEAPCKAQMLAIRYEILELTSGNRRRYQGMWCLSGSAQKVRHQHSPCKAPQTPPERKRCDDLFTWPDVSQGPKKVRLLSERGWFTSRKRT